MPRTPHLYERLAASGARFGEYHGLETAASFGSPAAEYSALHSGCGLFDLAWRTSFVARGEDRVRWLNGMVTNNVRDLPVGHGAYSFLLSPQGHILGDMVVFKRSDDVLIETDAEQAPRLRELLDKYIIMDDVELGDADAVCRIGLEGPKSAEVLRLAGLHPGDLQPLEMRTVESTPFGCTLVRNRSASGYEIWLAAENAVAAWDALVAAGATPVGFEAFEIWRVSQGIPRYGLDIRERDLPQETEQHQALNFTKGCYVGQEIVERIRSRGQVHRKFTGLVITGPTPAPGTKVSAAGKEVGEITSVARIPATNGSSRTLALGYIRREAAEPGAVVQMDSAEATVADLPFQEAQ
ncbi:MAG TPA: glycine cleavage T C-terminal barrel domain-containing protein [Terriglobales bacterium]|nr:glycine cleavage T C-terminal barrel domain-containing protein [Terriglobales bacterium]